MTVYQSAYLYTNQLPVKQSVTCVSISYLSAELSQSLHVHCTKLLLLFIYTHLPTNISTQHSSILLYNSDNIWGRDLLNILRQSYEYLTIMPMPKLRLTYDGRLIYNTSYEWHKAFLGIIHLQNRKIFRDSVFIVS